MLKAWYIASLIAIATYGAVFGGGANSSHAEPARPGTSQEVATASPSVAFEVEEALTLTSPEPPSQQSPDSSPQTGAGESPVPIPQADPPRALDRNVGGGFPRGCTASGSFEPAPCIPRGNCAIPEFICGREAGSINVWNYGGSGASGKYQAMPGTWGGYGGYLYAAWAPEWLQDEWAILLWDNGRGCSHWAAC